MPTRRILPVCLLSVTGAVLVGTCLGCSSDVAAGASSAADKRDTEMVHEDCDVGASSAKRIDVNGDGRDDIVHVHDGGREVCRVVDLNLDGAVDAFIYYDEQGQERRRESDFDRDGRADEIAIYQAGTIVRKERETNFDNKLDTWDYYEGGKIKRRERDSDGDGIVDQWWEFNNPDDTKCAIVTSDRDADGQPDPDSMVDLCGEKYGMPGTIPQPAEAEPPKESSEGEDGDKDADKADAEKDESGDAAEEESP